MQKLRIAEKLGFQECISIGNGQSDALMLEACAIGISVLGSEGLSINALLKSNIAVNCIHDALDLLLKKNRFIATLRS